ncbi:MAG: lipopolysaccharide biosynthesis protein [Planctomycetota bacterium]
MAVGRAASVVITVAATAVLARMLAPEDFGLVAMVAVVTNFARMFVDAGLAAATIQRQSLTRQQATNLFWIATGLGLLIAAAVASLAPVVALVYGEPRLTGITLAMAVSFVFAGLTVQHQALMRRVMQFGSLAGSQIVASISGQAAALAWAWQYRGQPGGYWALALIPIVTALVRMLTVWFLCGWRPGLPRRGAGTRSLLQFGANLVGFNFANYFARNADNLLLGWWWGPTVLGFYSRAYALLMMPLQQIMPSFASVIVPMLSRLQGEPEKYRRAFIAAVRPMLWISIPAVGLLVAAARPAVLLYLGPQWEPVVPLFYALAPAAWANTFVSCSGWVFTSWGRTDRQLRWGVAHSIVILVTIASTAPLGALTMAACLSVVFVLMRAPGFYYCFRGTPLEVRDLAGLIWRPTLAAGGAALAAQAACRWLLVGEPLLGGLLLATAVYAFTLLLIAGVTPGTIADVMKIRSALDLRRPQPAD